MARIQLHQIAHGRTGDKGNRLNVSVIAYQPEAWPVILDQVTEAKVLALFRHRGATEVRRYVLPQIQALNFVIDDVLEGGVNASLALDAHGKSNVFRVLAMEIETPDGLTLRNEK